MVLKGTGLHAVPEDCKIKIVSAVRHDRVLMQTSPDVQRHPVQYLRIHPLQNVYCAGKFSLS